MSELDLRSLAKRIPLAGDRALAEVVNGLDTVDALTTAEASQGFFKRLVSGKANRARRLESTTTLARTQRHMVSWVREVSDHLAYTDLCVGLLANEVAELQLDVARATAISEQALREIRELAGVLASFMDAVDEKFSEIDRQLDAHEQLLDAHAKELLELRRRTLASELWQSAWAESDTLIRRWRHEEIYTELPWACQVLLLARQAASGRPGLHEFVTGDRVWRERLADDLLYDAGTASLRESFCGQGQTVMVRRIVGGLLTALANPPHRRMMAELLGIGLPASLRMPHRPLTFAIAHGLELGAREPHASVDELTRLAVIRGRQDYGHLPDYLTIEEFVRRVVDEQADAASAARGNVRKEQRNLRTGSSRVSGEE